MGWFEISLNDSDVSNKVFSFRVEKELNKLEKGFLTVKEDLDVKYGDKVTIKYKWDEAGTVYERLLFEGFVTTIRRNYIRKIKEISCVGHGYKLLLRAINVSFVNADLNDIVSYVMNEVYGSQYSLDIDNNDTYPAEKTWDTNEDFETWSLTDASILNGLIKVYPALSLSKTANKVTDDMVFDFEDGTVQGFELIAGDPDSYLDVSASAYEGNYCMELGTSKGDTAIARRTWNNAFIYCKAVFYYYTPQPEEAEWYLLINGEWVKKGDLNQTSWTEISGEGDNVTGIQFKRINASVFIHDYFDYIQIQEWATKITNIPSWVSSVKIYDSSDNLLEEHTPSNGEIIIDMRKYGSPYDFKIGFVREDGTEEIIGPYSFGRNEIWEVTVNSRTGYAISSPFGPSNVSSWDSLDVQGSWESLTAYVLDEADNVLGTYTSFPADISAIDADKIKIKLEITASTQPNSVDLVKVSYLTGGLDISYNTSAKEVIRNACEMFVRDWWFDPSTLHVKTFRGTDYSGSIVFDGNNIVDFQLEENVFEYGNKIVLHYNGGTVVKQDDNSISTYGTIEKVYYNKDINTQEIAETYADYLLSLSLSKKTLHVEVVPEHEFLKTLDVGDQVSVQYADINEKFRIVKMFYEKKVGEEKLSFVLNKAFQDFYALLEKVRNAERWSL